MKKIIISILFLNFSIELLSQNSREEFSGQAAMIVKREKLNSASFISEVIPGCPEHWNKIIKIVSVTVNGYIEGQMISEHNLGEMLSSAQKNILNNSDLGMVISIDIWFRWKDSLSAIGEYGKIQMMNEYRIVVVPDNEAEYAHGSGQIARYLDDSIFKKIKEIKEYPKARAIEGMFTVDETGQIIDAKLLNGSANEEISKIYLGALRNMPKWKPAQNADGIKIKQAFRFNIPVPFRKELTIGPYGRSGC